MAQVLKTSKTVTHIDLSSTYRGGIGEKREQRTDGARGCVVNGIGDEGARALADALKTNGAVADINLRSMRSSVLL